MLRTIKWVLGLLALLVVAAFLHYVLPKHEVVYVTGVESRIVSPEEFSGFRAFGRPAVTGTNAQGQQGQFVADVFFINAINRGARPAVFRNEDTGFGFPPYLKFNAADLQAVAQRAVSTAAEPRWYVVRYYGWRINLVSMFPNALSMRAAPSPDVRIIPWFNIVFVSVLIAVGWAIWARVRRWSRRRADPVVVAWEVPAPPRRRWFRR